MCREFIRGACKRAESECRFAHPLDSVSAHEDGSVTVCMDAVKGRCARDPCRYFHPPLHLQAQIKAAQSRSTAVWLYEKHRHTHTHTPSLTPTHTHTHTHANIMQTETVAVIAHTHTHAKSKPSTTRRTPCACMHALDALTSLPHKHTLSVGVHVCVCERVYNGRA